MHNQIKLATPSNRCDVAPAVGGWRKRLAASEGTTLVEFGLVILMFMTLIFGVVDFARLFYAQTTLENAVRQAGRYAVTGNHQTNQQNGSQMSRIASITQVAQQAAVGLDVSNIQISSVTGGSGSAGGPQDTCIITVTSSVKLLTPVVAQFFTNGKYQFTVSVRFKNEPFPPNLTT